MLTAPLLPPIWVQVVPFNHQGISAEFRLHYWNPFNTVIHRITLSGLLLVKRHENFRGKKISNPLTLSVKTVRSGWDKEIPHVPMANHGRARDPNWFTRLLIQLSLGRTNHMKSMVFPHISERGQWRRRSVFFCWLWPLPPWLGNQSALSLCWGMKGNDDFWLSWLYQHGVLFRKVMDADALCTCLILWEVEGRKKTVL